MRLVDDHVDEHPARVFLVESCRCEVHVPGDHISGFDEDLGEDVFGAPPLMRRDQLRVSVHGLDRLHEVVEAP